MKKLKKQTSTSQDLFLQSQNQTAQKCLTGHTVYLENCKDCLSLKSEWYAYLCKTGFVDLEANERNLDSKATANLRHLTQFQEGIFEARRSYYQWAKEKLDYSEFRSEKDKLIWEYHSEGLSTREISPRIGLEQSWCVRKINKIKAYISDQAKTLGSMTFQMSTT